MKALTNPTVVSVPGRVLAWLLGFNGTVGLVGSLLLLIRGTEPHVITHFAGWWVPPIAFIALWLRKEKRRSWNVVAIAFYVLQSLAIYGPVEINWWIGLNYWVPLGDPEVDTWVVVLNAASLIFLAGHLWQLTTGSSASSMLSEETRLS